MTWETNILILIVLTHVSQLTSSLLLNGDDSTFTYFCLSRRQLGNNCVGFTERNFLLNLVFEELRSFLQKL